MLSQVRYLGLQLRYPLVRFALSSDPELTSSRFLELGNGSSLVYELSFQAGIAILKSLVRTRQFLELELGEQQARVLVQGVVGQKHLFQAAAALNASGTADLEVG